MSGPKADAAMCFPARWTEPGEGERGLESEME